jgi:O-antigen/teichoic acid export membrane protein
MLKPALIKDRLAQSSGVYFASKIFPAIFQVFNILFLSSLMPTSEYGSYATYLAVSLIFIQFFSAWLSQSILRYSSLTVNPKGFNSNQEIFGILGTLSALFASTFFLVFSLLMGLSIYSALPFCVFVFTEVLFQILYASFQSNELTSKVLILEGLKSVFSIGLLIFVNIVLKEISFFMPPAAISIANFICIIIFFKSLNITCQSTASILSKLVKDADAIKLYVTFGSSMTIFSTISLLILYFDRLIMPMFLNQTEIGIYVIIYDLSSKLIGFSLAPILLAVHPILARSWNNKMNNEFQGIKKKALAMQFIIGVIIILMSFFLLEIIVDLLPAYKDIYSNKFIFLVIGFSSLILQINQILHKNLEFSGKMNIMIIAASISLGVNILGNVIFLKTYGIVAAGVMSLLSSMTYSILVFTRNETR